ncbi:hypothetical protein IJD44_05925 [bacterium]|nr:hypothetical protein [bacterium]
MKDLKSLQVLIDWTQAQYGMLKIIIESKNELFYALQLQKRAVEIDDTVQKILVQYEVMIVVTAQHML